jgi:hypothetical protein
MQSSASKGAAPRHTAKNGRRCATWVYTAQQKSASSSARVEIGFALPFSHLNVVLIKLHAEGISFTRFHRERNAGSCPE